MDVIITRPIVDAEDFAQLIIMEGGKVILSPVMRIEAVKTSAPKIVGALAFTSANGVRNLAGARAYNEILAFAVGDQTAAAARAAGFSNIVTADGDVRSLADKITSCRPAEPVVHVAGANRSEDLARILAERGVNAQTLVAYKANPIRDMTDCARASIERGNALVTLFSPRSARLFLDQARRAGLTEALQRSSAVCLSSAVAAAANAEVWGECIVSPATSADAMARIIAEHIALQKGRG